MHSGMLVVAAIAIMVGIVSVIVVGASSSLTAQGPRRLVATFIESSTAALFPLLPATRTSASIVLCHVLAASVVALVVILLLMVVLNTSSCSTALMLLATIGRGHHFQSWSLDFRCQLLPCDF